MIVTMQWLPQPGQRFASFLKKRALADSLLDGGELSAKLDANALLSLLRDYSDASA